MVVRGSSIVLFIAIVGGIEAWSPQPVKYTVHLATPAPNGKTTQVSLYPPNGPVTIFSGPEILEMNKSQGVHAGHPVVVAMYASWCPHCWHLVPSWMSLGQAFSDNKDVEVGAVNCADAANRDVCDKAGVAGFPDIQCYGCPVTKECMRNGCTITVGFQTGGLSIPHWMANWISKATAGSVKASHPEALSTVEPGNGHVLIEGPPGEPGFIPSYFTRASKRSKDAMRGFLSAIWSKNDPKAALSAVKFLVSLFGPACCQIGGIPDALRTSTILDLPTLATALEGPLAATDMRGVISRWAALHSVHNLGDQETFAKFEKGMLSSGGSDSLETCTTYTCSLWEFLHMTTTSASYFAAAGSPRLTPGDVMKFTHDFVSDFLTCDACRHHFIASYDGCEFGRCKVNAQTDWQGMVMWLWRVHQGVSLRTAARDKAPVDRRWPSYEDCQNCWQPLGFKDENNVNTFDLSEIGKHSAELDRPFNLKNVYNFMVTNYVGVAATNVVANGKVIRRFDEDQPLLGQATESSTWLWLAFSVVMVVGAVASVSLWFRTMGGRQSYTSTVFSGDLEPVFMPEEDDACE